MGANLASSRGLVQQDRYFRAKGFTAQHILPGECDHPQGTSAHLRIEVDRVVSPLVAQHEVGLAATNAPRLYGGKRLSSVIAGAAAARN
jgi:hypothetical protein